MHTNRLQYLSMILMISACEVDPQNGGDGETVIDPGFEVRGVSEVNDSGNSEPAYFAILITDSQIFPTHRQVGTDPCATASSPLNAHGADIDAVALFDGSTLISYFDAVDYHEGGLCPGKPNTMTRPDDARGAPDATLTERFVALGGGTLIGEFTQQTEILDGFTVVVYEVGTQCSGDTSCGGVDEGYEVFMANDLDCVANATYPYRSCAVRLSDDSKGESSIPVSTF